MDSKKLALLCRDLAENRKAENVVVLDVTKVSSITDYFIIATGTSEPHLRAIVDEITEKLADDHDLKPKAHEGSLHTSWIVLDYFDVIVHIMRATSATITNSKTSGATPPRSNPKNPAPAKRPPNKGRARRSARAYFNADDRFNDHVAAPSQTLWRVGHADRRIQFDALRWLLACSCKFEFKSESTR